jgi:hypothetical protein
MGGHAAKGCSADRQGTPPPRRRAPPDTTRRHEVPMVESGRWGRRSGCAHLSRGWGFVKSPDIIAAPAAGLPNSAIIRAFFTPRCELPRGHPARRSLTRSRRRARFLGLLAMSSLTTSGVIDAKTSSAGTAVLGTSASQKASSAASSPSGTGEVRRASTAALMLVDAALPILGRERAVGVLGEAGSWRRRVPRV